MNALGKTETSALRSPLNKPYLAVHLIQEIQYWDLFIQMNVIPLKLLQHGFNRPKLCRIQCNIFFSNQKWKKCFRSLLDLSQHVRSGNDPIVMAQFLSRVNKTPGKVFVSTFKTASSATPPMGINPTEPTGPLSRPLDVKWDLSGWESTFLSCSRQKNPT